MLNRRIDDASGNTAIHLVNGIWGQISVGLFADPVDGLKGLFIDGSTYQLIVQTISALSLMIWSAFATLILIWVVDLIIPVRMTPEDELKGGDLVDLFYVENTELIPRKSLTTLDRIISIATPIARRFSASVEARRFSASVDDKYQREYDKFGNRKMFHVNEAYDRRDSVKSATRF